MTNNKDTSGPAFPVPHSIDGNWQKEPMEKYQGISMRDYFAAAALQGYLAGRGTNLAPDHWADLAYMCADEMLKRRLK